MIGHIIRQFEKNSEGINHLKQTAEQGAHWFGLDSEAAKNKPKATEEPATKPFEKDEVDVKTSQAGGSVPSVDLQLELPPLGPPPIMTHPSDN